MRALVLLALVLAVPGCFECSPTLEVHDCLPDACEVREADPVIEWDERWAKRWPDIDKHLGMERGGHEHTRFDADMERSFWHSVGIDPERQEKQAFVASDDRLFRVRILSCP